MVSDGSGNDTFPKLLHHHAAQRGNRPASREKSRGIWRTQSWREMADEAKALAVALAARGVVRGSHVAFLGDNRPRLYSAMCAAQCLGAIAVPLYQDSTAAELVSPLQRAEVTHVFAENQEQVDKLLSILPQCPAIRCIVYDKDRGMRHYRQPQLVSFAVLLQEGRDAAGSKRDFVQEEIARGSGRDAAFLFFTSGTTGVAKGVVLTHGSLIDRAGVVAKAEGLRDTDVALAYLPPGWIGQNLFGYVQPMVVGYCVCSPESSDTMLADMREVGPTYFLATPRVLEAIVTHLALRLEDSGGLNRLLYDRAIAVAHRIAGQKLAGKAVSTGDRIASVLYGALIYGPLRDALGMSKVRIAFTAGDAIAPSLLMFYRALGINLKQLYGSTETGFLVAMQRDGDVRPDSVGKAMEGVEIDITPQNEILVRSPGLFARYHGDADTTDRSRNADGWFQTGDAGYVGDDGHLRIIDRMKYVGALKSGASFAPRLIENRLRRPSYVKEAVAIGDGRDMVCAFIDIDLAAVGRWADKKAISYTGHADLATRDEVYELIARGIAEVNADLAQEPGLAASQINRFLILPSELSADDGMLTHTGKLRRDVIAERFKPLIDAMYDGRNEADAGPEGTIWAGLKIRNVATTPTASARRAA